MEEQEDRISDLQDCLLVEILSRLPTTKEAIKTGILSKRWICLWPQVHNLNFVHAEFHYLNCFFTNVEKTLTQCPQSDLSKFRLNMTFHNNLFELRVKDLISYATNRNVQDLDLSFSNRYLYPAPDVELDQSFYINSSFTHLKLKGCIFKPSGTVSWYKLKSLSITERKLDEDLIQIIFSGSPLLETFELEYCCGFRRIDITSKNLKNLVLSGYGDLPNLNEEYTDIIKVKAPHIMSLTIDKNLYLWKFLLLNVSSLVTAKLDYKKEGHYETTPIEAEEEMLKGFILSLRHVKELKLGDLCLEVLSCLEAKGFVFPSSMKFTSS